MFNKPTQTPPPLDTLEDYLIDHLRRLAYANTQPKKVLIAHPNTQQLEKKLKEYVPSLTVEYHGQYTNGMYCIEYWRGLETFKIEGKFVRGETVAPKE